MLWAWTTRCQDGFAKHLFEALRFCKKSFDRNFSYIAVVLAWKPHLLLDPPRISLKQTTPVGWGSDWSSLQCWRAIAIRDNNYAPFSCFMLWALTTGCPNCHRATLLFPLDGLGTKVLGDHITELLELNQMMTPETFVSRFFPVPILPRVGGGAKMISCLHHLIWRHWSIRCNMRTQLNGNWQSITAELHDMRRAYLRLYDFARNLLTGIAHGVVNVAAWKPPQKIRYVDRLRTLLMPQNQLRTASGKIVFIPMVLPSACPLAVSSFGINGNDTYTQNIVYGEVLIAWRQKKIAATA